MGFTRVEIGPDRHYSCWINAVMATVVMIFVMHNIDGLGDTGVLIKIPSICP